MIYYTNLIATDLTGLAAGRQITQIGTERCQLCPVYLPMRNFTTYNLTPAICELPTVFCQPPTATSGNKKSHTVKHGIFIHQNIFKPSLPYPVYRLTCIFRHRVSFSFLQMLSGFDRCLHRCAPR